MSEAGGREPGAGFADRVVDKPKIPRKLQENYLDTELFKKNSAFQISEYL